MRLYLLQHDGEPLVFAGSKDSAVKCRQDVATDRGLSKKNISISEVDVPTDKQGLLGYLNVLLA